MDYVQRALAPLEPGSVAWLDTGILENLYPGANNALENFTRNLGIHGLAVQSEIYTEPDQVDILEIKIGPDAARKQRSELRKQKAPRLRNALKEAGKTKIYVDASGEFKDPKKTAVELAELKEAGAEVFLYNLKAAERNGAVNPLLEILNSFAVRPYRRIEGPYQDILRGLKNEADEVNLVHYSKNAVPELKNPRIVSLTGKAGSAVYGVSKIKKLREASKLRRSLPDLDIFYDEETNSYRISDERAQWMARQLDQFQFAVALQSAA